MSKYSYKRIGLRTPEGAYSFLLCLYLIANIISTKGDSGGGLINQIFAAVIILFCLSKLLFSKHFVPEHGKSVYKILVLFVFFVVTRIVVMVFVDVKLALSSIRNGVAVLFWVVGLLFCIKEYDTQTNNFSRSSAILIIVSIINFLYSIIIKRRYFMSLEEIGAVNSAGSAYMLVPLILIALKGKTKHLAYLLCLVVCAWSQKRQCLLGFALVSLFILGDLLKDYFHTFKFAGIIYIFLVFAFSSEIVGGVFSGIIERQKYLSEKSEITDSGRAELRAFALDGYLKAPTSQKIFGGGPGTGGRYIEDRLGFFIAPHCGFIEVLCDYGFIGFSLFVLFFVSLLKICYRLPRGTIDRKIMIGIVLAWVMSNIVSHAGRVWSVYFCIAIGYIVNSNSRKEVILNS